MKILTRADAARFLLEHDHFAILSHRRPDGDTVGSSAALCRGLRQLGKTAHVLVNKEVTPRFAWLHEGLTKPWVEEGDTVVSVDVASPEMLPADFRPLLGKIALRIDHHSSATSFTEQELVDGDSASCAEVVWDVLELMGVKADRALAEAAHTFSVAALCTRAGARIYELNQELFETNTLERLKMQAWIVEHLELLRGGEMAICAIPRAVEEEIGVNEDDMDNISNFPRTVAGVRMAATLRETEDGETKLSVRAVPGCDATAVTVRFGGGGHKGAAGASMKLPLDEAVKAVEAVMLEVN